jgi:hypothetical protein
LVINTCFIEIFYETKETANFEAFGGALSDFVSLLVGITFDLSFIPNRLSGLFSAIDEDIYSGIIVISVGLMFEDFICHPYP